MLKAQKRISELEEFLKSKAGDYVYGYGDESLSSAIGKMLIDKKKTVAVAESCTGGMLGAAFTDNPGSSEYFFGGIIAYSNDVKISQVNVKPETIDNFGAVSEETAVELAVNIRKIFNTDFGIGVTGIAGPTGGSPEKPVGTVWIALADKTSVKARKFVFGNDRAVNREIAVGRALTMLYEKLHKL
jgi:nicotinamide-nucleotide amidase